MAKFLTQPSLTTLNEMSANTLVSALGITIDEIGDDWLAASMPVDARTKQPFGLLHGGANVALAETLASIGAQLMLPEGKLAVGLEINANHLNSVRSGWIRGHARALKVGRSTQVWQVEIFDDQDRLSCVCRMTAAVVDQR